MNNAIIIEDINERLTKFAHYKDYVIELRLSDCIDYKIEMYKNLTDILPEVKAPLKSLYNLIDCFQFVEHIKVYYGCVVYIITKK